MCEVRQGASSATRRELASCPQREASAAVAKRYVGPHLPAASATVGVKSARTCPSGRHDAVPGRELDKENRPATALTDAHAATVLSHATATVQQQVVAGWPGGNTKYTGKLLPGMSTGTPFSGVLNVPSTSSAAVPQALSQQDAPTKLNGVLGCSSASTMPARRGRGRSRSEARRSLLAAEELDPKALQSATSLGNGISLTCFCPRHEELVLHRPQFLCCYPGGRFGNLRAELTREQLRARGQLLLREHDDKKVLKVSPHPEQESGFDCGRAVQHAGLGNDGVAVSLEPATGRGMSFTDWRSRGHRAPEAVAIAREKRTFVRQLPYLVTGRLRQQDDVVRALGVTCIRASLANSSADSTCGTRHLASVTDLEPSSVLEAFMEVGRAARGQLPEPLVKAAVAAGARSLTERYAAMRASVGQRLAAGKSAIHGWGAFAKVLHKRGALYGLPLASWKACDVGSCTGSYLTFTQSHLWR